MNPHLTLPQIPVKLRGFSHPALAALLLATLMVSPTSAQTVATMPPTVDTSSAQAEATVLRDAFVARLHAAGFSCPLPVPPIVMEDVLSFGQYRPDTNVICTSNWDLLNPHEKAMFVQLAGPGKNEDDAHHLFDLAHKWIFIHELGHWWQACNGGNAGKSHCQVEYGANRISLSYWREADPQVGEIMRPVFQSFLDHAPSPVPPGQSVEDYFNANYETLGPGPRYPWFMSRMNLAAFDETPFPSFAAALKSQKPSY
jgi:hypothetical protein